MEESSQHSQVVTPTAPSVWGVNRSKKDPKYYEATKEKYKEFLAGNELLPIPSVSKFVSVS